MEAMTGNTTPEKRAEQLIARWANIATTMLDGILEDCKETEDVEKLVADSRLFLSSIGHVHRYSRCKYAPDFRECYCGVTIRNDEYEQLKSQGKQGNGNES